METWVPIIPGGIIQMLEVSFLKTGQCEDGDEKGSCTYREMSKSHPTMFLPQMLQAWHLPDCASVGYGFAVSLLERHFISTSPVFR